jgi:hypothetical protein
MHQSYTAALRYDTAAASELTITLWQSGNTSVAQARRWLCCQLPVCRSNLSAECNWYVAGINRYVAGIN